MKTFPTDEISLLLSIEEEESRIHVDKHQLRLKSELIRLHGAAAQGRFFFTEKKRTKEVIQIKLQV